MPKLLRQQPGSVGEYYEGLRTQGGKLIKEVYHVTCAHRGCGVEFESRRQMMDHVNICPNCMKLICLKCAALPCVPQEKWVELQELEAKINARNTIEGWGCY